MYKGVSQSLQRRYAVDKPHPSKGYIDSGPDASAALPDASHLTKAQATQERDQLKLELARCAHDLTVAKATGNLRAVAHLGQRHQAIQARLIPVNARLRDLSLESDDALFAAAVRAAVDADTWQRILDKKAELVALAAAAREGGDVKQAPAESPHSGPPQEGNAR